MYVARELFFDMQNPDKNESIEIIKMSLGDAYAKVQAGDIQASPAVLMIQKLMLDKTEGN